MMAPHLNFIVYARIIMQVAIGIEFVVFHKMITKIVTSQLLRNSDVISLFMPIGRPKL